MKLILSFLNKTGFKNLLVIIFLGFNSIELNAQKVNFNWAKQFEGVGIPFYGSSITLDIAGNVYAVGNFQGMLDFDPGPGYYPLTAIGNTPNLFISKLDPNGNFLWAKSINCSANGINKSIVTDASGNVFITGRFQDTVDFDPGTGIYNLYANTSISDIFILKLNSFGNFIWARQLKCNGGTNGPTSIVFDKFANVYLCGYFSQTIDIDPGLAVKNFTTTGLHDIFISKLDSSGNLNWAKQIGGSGLDHSISLSRDENGGIYITGNYEGTVDFDPGPGVFDLQMTGLNYSIFILKLDTNGNFIWAKSISGTFQQASQSIAADDNGNVYLYGWFSDTVDFDPGVGIHILASPSFFGYPNLFLLKLNSVGNFLWVKQFTGGHSLRGNNLSLNGKRGIDFIGHFKDTVDFDPGPGTFNLISKGNNDIFICELNEDGNLEWAKQIGGSGSDLNSAIYSDSSGVYSIGIFANTVDFDPDTSTHFLTAPSMNYYILKWNKCNSVNTMNLIVCDSVTINGVLFKNSGKYFQVFENYKGCDSTITLNITIVKKPKAKFTLQTQAGCQYVAYTFIDSSFADTVSNAGYSYYWDFGDGTNSTINSPSRINTFNHTYTNSGTFTVKLIFSNGFCMDSFSIINNVFILPAPKPGFTINSKKGCSPFVLNLKDTSTADIVLKEYDFGNGYVSLKNNKALDTIIQITNSGVYIIKQKLTGTTGCITQYSDTIYITPGLTTLNTVDVLYTTVIDSFTTFTQWEKLPNAVSYSIINQIVTDTFYTHLNAQPALQSEKYYIVANDSCGNKSAVSPVSQTIYLKGENQNFNEFALLQYTPYETWKNGVLRYQIEYKNNTTNTWVQLDSSNGNVHSSKVLVMPNDGNSNISSAQICYRVIAIEQNGNNQISVSNVACVPVYPIVFLPNAFSPNGDGINDYYKPVAAGLNAYIFEIYDRWGTLVYTDNPDSKGWDGTFRGEPATEGAYVFRLSAAGYLLSPATNDARRVERKGTLFLVR